jgi:hypothetical protein
MTAPKTSPQTTIQHIQTLLSEGYGSGFTIFKELVQNADDVGAKRLLLAGHDGFSDADNILLRVPGIFVANDGPVSSAHWEALQLAAGGSKGAESQAVGRFGLGQKALYHLCDAYAVFARRDGEAKRTSMVLNPYEDIETADHAREWKVLSERDEELLGEWADRADMGGGLVLRIPLRTSDLRPGSDPRMCLTQASWTPREALKDILDGEQLQATIACLRHLELIEIECPGESAWRAELKPGFVRLAGPGEAAQVTMQAAFGGCLSINGKRTEVHGVQHNAANGAAVALQSDPNWPTAWTLTGLDKAKATPHGAAIICRHPTAKDSKAKLRIWHGVYLPLGDPARDKVILEEAELAGDENLELIVHGDFFVSSNRASILREDGNKGQDTIKTKWNEALEREATLPCVLDAVASAINALPSEPARYDLVRALGGSGWWRAYAANICGGRTLVRLLDGKIDQWSIKQAATLRPIPLSDATRPQRLDEAWKGFADWCASSGFVLAQGSTLGEMQPEWSDNEMAELVSGMAPAALAGKNAAQTLARILEAYREIKGQIGPIAREALSKAFRAAMVGKGKVAPMEQIRLLSRHLPTDGVLALPKSVTEPELLAHLAGQTQTLCIRADWLGDDWPQSGAVGSRNLLLDEAVELLAALEPLAAHKGRIQNQAVTMIGHVLQFGPKLAQLARDGRASALRVIPLVRARDRAEIMVTPTEALDLIREGLLFHHAPPSQLEKLAAAVLEPAIHIVRQNIPLEAPLGMALASSNRPGDKAAVVGKAQQFGHVRARTDLFGELRQHLSPPVLRRLIAGKADLRTDEKLARIVGLPAPLMPLVSKLVGTASAIHVLDPTLAGKLSHEEAEKADVAELDINWLGSQLARRRDLGEPLDDEQAMALLATDLPSETLSTLALHKVQGETGLHRRDALLRGRLDDVPQAMRDLVRIVDPWHDRKAAQRQAELIADWTPQRQIALALASDDPHHLTSEILCALDQIANLDEALKFDLRQRPWLTLAGCSVAPEDIRDLLPCAISALKDLLPDTNPVLLSELSPEAQTTICKHHLIDDRAKAYHDILRALAAKGLNGLMIDLVEQRSDLAVLARAKCDLDDAIWPIMASTLRAFESDDFRAVLANVKFAAPAKDAAIDQLNGLVALVARGEQIGDSALKLWRIGFEKWTQDLRKGNGFLPGDLMVESEAGTFARAEQLALDPSGVEPRDSLAARWRFDLSTDDYTPAAAPKRLASASIADQAPELFAPFLKFHELHSAVLMVLAMLGRDPAIRRVADKFSSNPGFDDICANLDTASKRLLGLCDPLPTHMAQMRLAVVPLSNGQALVLSAAGTVMLAHAQHEGALLYGCTKADDAPHSWQLSMSAIEPRDLDHATRLLRDAIAKLAVPIGMRMNNQLNAVLAQFDSYLASDQATLDELVRDIKDGLAERIKKLTRGSYLKSALSEYDADRKQGRHESDDTVARQRAKDNLWAAICRPEAAGELLSAIREKMHNRNYAPERTLFELFQNAVDAAHQKGEKSDLRVEAERDETGAIITLRVIHWGRPINVMGGPDTPARFERDLDNMLDLDSSEKEGQDRGKHGLGFKTCHMLSDDTRVASGRLLLRIRGGMIPQGWEKGRDHQQRHNTPDAQATIVELPVADGREGDAAHAWDEFTKVAAFLPVVASNIGEIVIVDGQETRSGKADVIPLTQAIALVEYGLDQRALRLDLGAEHYLYCKLLDGTPTPFATAWSRLWNLAPLDGEDLHVSWLIDGKFEMDQGRRGLHGQAEKKAQVMQQRGGQLGERLVELFTDWTTIAPVASLQSVGRDAFFARLIDLLVSDTSDQLARNLHGISGAGLQFVESRGLTTLVARCPVVPLAGGGFVCAGDVEGVYSHTLTDPAVRQKVESWSVRADNSGNVIEEQWSRRLEALGFPAPPKVDLGSLAMRLCACEEVDGQLAAELGAVFNSRARYSWYPEEGKRVEEALKTVRLRAQNGDFVPSNELWIPQDPREGSDGKTERLRADFMPPKARLHPEYEGDAVEFAQLARAIAGYRTFVEREHLKTAYLDDNRCRAALVYLSSNPEAIADLNWLTDVAALHALPASKHLTRQQLGTLEAWLVDDRPNLDDEPELTRSAEEILFDVADWWEGSREALSADYDKQVYGELGELCSTAALKSDDDAAWFTMLSLASFQTLGRITPQQSRAFLQRGVSEGWWHDLATIDENDRELIPYVKRLLEWSDIGATEDYLIWRRCLGDMCLIARNVDAYREILTALPQIIEQVDEPLALSQLFRPSTSQIVGRMGVDAAPLARSLGMGANWIVRELARRGFYDPAQAELVQPFAWSARLRIRNFVRVIGLSQFESGVDQGTLIHGTICEAMNVELPFGIDGDLPLELLNTRKRGSGWRPEREDILRGNWCANNIVKVVINA